MTATYFRIWYGLLSESEGSKAPSNRSRSDAPALQIIHVKSGVGAPFEDVIISTPGTDSTWEPPLKIHGVVPVQGFYNARVLYVDCGKRSSDLRDSDQGSVRQNLCSPIRTTVSTMGRHHYERTAAHAYQTL